MTAITDYIKLLVEVRDDSTLLPDSHGRLFFSDGECTIGVFLSDAQDLVCLCATPGYMGSPASLRAESTPYSATAWGEDEASQTVRIEPVTGKLTLIRAWPRHWMTAVRFENALTEFSDSIRSWRMLLASSESQAGNVDDAFR
ncbi:MAG TPA: type III secretion system chaperone, partial [Burkholderiaceae bacterium]|nr:type III secretion system chaperone [Burkholderiaceae bacterium]